MLSSAQIPPCTLRSAPWPLGPERPEAWPMATGWSGQIPGAAATKATAVPVRSGDPSRDPARGRLAGPGAGGGVAAALAPRLLGTARAAPPGPLNLSHPRERAPTPVSEIRASDRYFPRERTPNRQYQTADGLNLIGETRRCPRLRGPRRHADLPAPAADARRDDGQPRVTRRPPTGCPRWLTWPSCDSTRAGPSRSRAAATAARQRQLQRFDVEAAVGWAVAHDLPRPWLLGWSFGTARAALGRSASGGGRDFQ